MSRPTMARFVCVYLLQEVSPFTDLVLLSVLLNFLYYFISLVSILEAILPYICNRFIVSLGISSLHSNNQSSSFSFVSCYNQFYVVSLFIVNLFDVVLLFLIEVYLNGIVLWFQNTSYVIFAVYNCMVYTILFYSKDSNCINDIEGIP